MFPEYMNDVRVRGAQVAQERRHEALRGVLRAVIPLSIRQSRYENTFFHSKGLLLHLGVFESLDEAQVRLRAHSQSGQYSINHREWFAQRSATYRAHDYPVLYWMSKLIEPSTRLFDLGGSVGVTYHLMRTRLALPGDFRWEVGELPAVVAYGRELMSRLESPHLQFTDDWKSMDGALILHVAGALQFMPLTLAEMFSKVRRKPQHVLINRIPVTDTSETFYTLQNTGDAIAPMRVEARRSLLGDMKALGYELVDGWKCLENSLVIPFASGHDLRCFDGFYFRRA